VVELKCQHKNQTLLVEGPEIIICPVGARQWSMHDRFSAEDLQAMIDLYTSGLPGHRLPSSSVSACPA
jgi:hypothetical protein